MRFSITVDSEDDAIMSDPIGEVSRIIDNAKEKITRHIHCNWSTGDYAWLYDSNGNRVGTIKYIK